MRFDEKIALVTGGASGIGKATVMAFARAGATVICADIDAAVCAQYGSVYASGGVRSDSLSLKIISFYKKKNI